IRNDSKIVRSVNICLFWVGVALLFLPSVGLTSSELSVSSSNTAYVNPRDLLIQGGLVVDGTGSKPEPADVLVRGGKIQAVAPHGLLKAMTSVRVIDAAGRVVAPGFIDPHSHGDPLETPGFENFLAQGVTTITLGQDGSSPATADFPKLFTEYEAKGLGVNIAMFVGHGSLRADSGIGQNAHPSDEDLARMTQMLDDALDHTFGMSSGLEYQPGLWASSGELEALAKVVGARDRVIMSHMRNEDDDQLDASIDELLAQGRFARVHAAHLKSVYGQGAERGQAIIQRLQQARASGIQVTADFYPYTASYTSVSLIFPVWGKTQADFEANKITRRADLLQHLRHRVLARNGPGAMLMANAPYTGMTLDTVAKQLGKPFEVALVDDLGPNSGSAAYFVMNEALQGALLEGEMVMVGSDGSPTGFHPRGHGSVARIIEREVLEQQRLSLAVAVKKMTSMPADVLGLKDRGRIAPGMVADLVVFAPEAVRETATFESPHQLAEGFDWVVISGQVAFQSGQGTVARLGRVLRPAD
ncbi:MAG: N-acyl-D-amino-acid deacylase family protein, partial [Pseudomonadales bacterium]